MPSGLTTDDGPALDGRRARRERGRTAATDAMIDLVFEGHLPPTPEQVAERAGISVASLFRYFDTLDDMRREAIDRYVDRYADVFEVAEIGAGTRSARIERFVAAREHLHATTQPIARLARLRAVAHDGVANALHRARATEAEQIRLHFERELADVSPAGRDDAVAIIATVTSFEAWDQLHDDHGRSPAQIRRAWASALTRLLDPS